MPLRHLHVDAEPGTRSAARLATALAALRDELGLDHGIEAAERAEAIEALRAGPRPLAGRARRDARDLALVTIDPAGSRDLDQAVGIAPRPGGTRVHYAIADVAAFIAPLGALDRGARGRGLTLYCPDLRLPLYPAELSEGAASLLPGRDRPALLWTFDVDEDGECRFARLERAWVRSRAALSYAQVQGHFDRAARGDARAARPAPHAASFVHLAAFGRARQAAEERRGGVSLPIASQTARVRGDSIELAYERSRPVEAWNAHVSLLTGMQAAHILLGARRGLLRTLPPADARTLRELRLEAKGLGIAWPAERSYPEFVRSLDPARPTHAAMLAQCTRALRGAGYLALGADAPSDERARHAAIASPYAHVTAPLRRLADRFTNEVALALFEGREAPGWALEAIEAMPEAMGVAARRASELERASIDLIEAFVLEPHVGERFQALVVRSGRRSSRVQLRKPAVRAEAEGGLPLGRRLPVELVEADPGKRRVRFARA